MLEKTNALEKIQKRKQFIQLETKGVTTVWQISTSRLKFLQTLYLKPITSTKALVLPGSLPGASMIPNLGVGFALRCFQCLSLPDDSYPAMLLAEQLVHQRSVPCGPLVLARTPLKYQRLRQIGDQPVLRRFEPSSRTFLIGEQPNPWKLLHLQDKMSRHRGAEQSRRYGLSGSTSLLSPG